MMCGLFTQYINGESVGEGYICFGEFLRFSGYTGEKAGAGGTATKPAAEDDSEDEKEKRCNELSDRIQTLRDDLAKRTSDLVEDKLLLPASGPGSLAGHKQQFRHKQRALRKAIDDFNTLGCGGALPFDAWDYATNPVPAKGKRDLPHRLITPAPRVVPFTPVPVPVRPSTAPIVVPLPIIIIRCLVAKDCGQAVWDT